MIPTDIEMMMQQVKGAIRDDVQGVEKQLKILGVPESSQLAEFFSRFKVGALPPDSSGEELMELAGTTNQILNSTRFAHDVFGVPERFVALTSGEGEGFYLYDPTAGSVFDVSAKEISSLAAGSLAPRWPDFFTFVRWFLSNPYVPRPTVR